MYNRYIGNTGKYVRVEEPEHRQEPRHRPEPARHPGHTPQHPTVQHEIHHHEPPRPEPARAFPGLGGLGSLGNLFKKSPLFGGGHPGGLLKSLPFGLDIGDLAVLVLLFFLYIESGDEEFLIILAFLAYSFFKDG